MNVLQLGEILPALVFTAASISLMTPAISSLSIRI
jgi:hypothetical protein